MDKHDVILSYLKRRAEVDQDLTAVFLLEYLKELELQEASEANNESVINNPATSTVLQLELHIQDKLDAMLKKASAIQTQTYTGEQLKLDMISIISSLKQKVSDFKYHLK